MLRAVASAPASIGNVGLGFDIRGQACDEADILVEPQRAHLVPQFSAVKRAAMAAGALGCSFDGSGPSVFAWALAEEADQVEDAMLWTFVEAGLAARAYRAPVESSGVRLERVVEVV